jgi:sugar phosphate permease
MAFTWAVTQGLLQGASNTVRQVIFPDYYGRKSLGAIRGVITPVQLTSNAIGPTVAAIAFDATGNYVAIFLIFGLMRMISAFLVAFARPPEGSMASLGRTYWKKGGGEGGGGRGGH